MSASEPSPANLLDRRYRLLQVVAHGSLGRVYRARHVGLDAIVALKELRPPARVADEACEAARSRFFREARALTALSHPNLPRVHDYFSHGRACFLVMDFVEGKPLAARARRLERLPLDEVLGYGLQMCDALAYLHQQCPPLYLGTLSLSDIIITREGQAMLADLGVAHRFARAMQDGDQACASAPQPDAGDALASAEGNIRADVLSLGAVLHEVLVGEDPAVDMRHLTSSHELDPRTSSELDVIIATALGLLPNRRFATIEEMGHALRAVAHHLMPVSRAAPSTARPLAGGDAQPMLPASLPLPPEPLPRHALAAAPRPGTGADGVLAGDGMYRASGASLPRAPTRPRWPDRMAPPAASRRRERAIGALATSALAFAAVTALALALSLSAGSGATFTAGSRSAMGVSATQVAPPPASQRAASQLGGPPSNANPPDEQFIRSSPPTPTPRPPATAHPISGPTPPSTATPHPIATPTARSSPCDTPTVPPYPSGTPEPSPSPSATPTGVAGSGAASQPTRDTEGTTWHTASGMTSTPDDASSPPQGPGAVAPASASPPPGPYPPCASGAGDGSPMPGDAGAVDASALSAQAPPTPTLVLSVEGSLPPFAPAMPPGWLPLLAVSSSS